MRLNKGFTLFDVPVMMDKIKTYYQNSLQKLVDNDPRIANDIDADHNNIEKILNISYALRILKLVIIIGNISYLLGLMWLVMCDLVFDFSYDMDKYS